MDPRQCMVVDLERRGNKQMFVTEKVAFISENKNGLWSLHTFETLPSFNFSKARPYSFYCRM